MCSACLLYYVLVCRWITCDHEKVPNFHLIFRKEPLLRDVFFRWEASDHAAEGKTDRVRELQQTPAVARLSGRHAFWFLKFYAAGEHYVLSWPLKESYPYGRIFSFFASQVGVRWVKFVNRTPKICVNTTLTSTWI